MIDKLIKFAKAHHEGFEGMPDKQVRRMFETYKDTTLVNYVDGEVRGFGIYQEWPDLLNFICLGGNPEGDVYKNILAMMDAKVKIPGKKIVYFDEKSMELKVICPQHS